jgi:hypothetical protein
MEIQFRVLGIPVQVSALFLLSAVILGRGDASTPVLMAAWIVIMFVGILMHELGHALTARAFGQEPAISLHGLGGVTVWQPREGIGPGKRALITLAGPMVGLVVGFPALIVGLLLTTEGTPAYQVVKFVYEVNLFWAIFNLLPMLPLDGGASCPRCWSLPLVRPRCEWRTCCPSWLPCSSAFSRCGAGPTSARSFCAFFIFLNVQGSVRWRGPPLLRWTREIDPRES